MPATIFSGSNIKGLKANYDFNGESIIVNGELAAANNTADQTIYTLPATARGFEGIITVFVDGTTDVYTTFRVAGIQKAASFDMSQSFNGDAPTVTLDITSGGIIRITTPSITGYVSCAVKYTLSVQYI